MSKSRPESTASKAVGDPARLRASALVGAPAWPSTSYSFADALDQEAFDQLELVTASKFARLASDRGIRYLRRETLEWLDKQGAVRPIGFQTNSGKPALHSKRFSGWDRYARKVWDHPQVDALYSPWQLLYLDAAVNGRYVDVDVTAFLDSDTNLTAKPRSAWRQIHTRRHREWKRLDAAWRPVILLLVRIQNRYFPAVRGTVKMGLGGDDPFRREVASFDPPRSMNTRYSNVTKPSDWPNTGQQRGMMARSPASLENRLTA